MPTPRAARFLLPLLISAGVAHAEAAFSSADAARDYILAATSGQLEWDRDRGAAAQEVLLAEIAAADSAPTREALAVAAIQLGDPKAARAHAERAIALSPARAQAHYLLGDAIFNDLKTASTLDQLSLASKGKKAYERAVELDPNHLGANLGLATFYLHAPGIAGGSNKKARAIANHLLSFPEGVYHAHIVLAQLAADDKDWAGLRQEFDAAWAASDSDADRLGAVRTYAALLLQKKHDSAAALAALERASSLPGADTPSLLYIAAESHRRLKDLPQAVALYRAVLEKSPGSPNSRFALAQCLEAMGDLAAAVEQYDEFASRFPDDKRTGDARAAAKKLRKKLR